MDIISIDKHKSQFVNKRSFFTASETKIIVE